MSNFREQLQTGCYALIDGYGTAYGYQPSLAAGIVFLALFGLSMLAHTVQMTWTRTWWCAVFSVGCISMFLSFLIARRDGADIVSTIAEIIGWAGRTWSAQCPYNMNAFLMQISTLIIGETFPVTIASLGSSPGQSGVGAGLGLRRHVIDINSLPHTTEYTPSYITL